MATQEEPNIIAIANGALAECQRQQVGFDEYIGLLKAYQGALYAQKRIPHFNDLYILAMTIDPKTEGCYRLVPVTFANGGNASTHETIYQNMERLFQFLDKTTDPYEWVRSFLSIHPFIDGNGRCAWILYNWLSHALNNPVPLPDFKFGEIPMPDMER